MGNNWLKKYRSVSKGKYKKNHIVVVSFLLFLFVATFGLGPINLSLNKSQTDGFGSGGSTSNLNVSSGYEMKLFYNEKEVGNCGRVTMGAANTALELKIDPIIFKGNYYTPFYKKFRVEYTSEFKNVGIVKSLNSGVKVSNVVESTEINGHYQGSIELKIIGLCSINNAKEIAEQNVFQFIKTGVAGTIK